jgi:phosphohistidine swiveling domain-containing protein
MFNTRQQAELEMLKETVKPLFLWNGSITDFITSPTPLTNSLILCAFNNANTLLRVTSTLGLASYSSQRNYFVTVLHKPYLDLVAENTIFFGDCAVNIHESDSYTKPVSKPKISPTNILPLLSNTVEHVAWTTKIIASHKGLEIAEMIQNNVRSVVNRTTKRDSFLTDEEMSELLANIIAIGMLDSTLHEYIASTLAKKYRRNWATIEEYFIDEYKDQDAYFQSIQQLEHVASGKISMDAYIQMFGHRAFNDFELSSPRFHETPEKVSSIVQSIPNKESVDDKIEQPTLNMQEAKLLHMAYQIRSMRGSIRLESLRVIDHTRRIILQKSLEHQIPDDLVFYMTKFELLQNPNHSIGRAQERKQEFIEDSNVFLPPLLSLESLHSLHQKKISKSYKVFTPVSRGVVKGKIKRVNSEFEKLDSGTAKYILVLPDSSPKYSHLYPYGAGIIFCSGGVMSHGAIVAREYKKPAITLGGKRLEIPDGEVVELDATRGRIHLQK